MRFWNAVVGTLCTAIGLVCGGVRSGAAQDASWLRNNKRSSPERVEGLLDQPNARREYDVLSFEVLRPGMPQKLAPNHPAKLMVQYCQPRGSGGAAYIEVRQMTVHVNYLMRAAQSSGTRGWETFAWPTQDVIDKYNIDPQRLGVVIHLGEDNEYAEDLAPAILTEAGDAAVRPGPISAYVLSLRIQQRAIDRLRYVIEDGGRSTTCTYAGDDVTACGKPAEGRPIEEGSLVQLRLPMAGMPDGETSVRIEGSYANSDDKLMASFHFEHESTCQ